MSTVGRNLTFQPLRGIQANLQSAMPLALGEMFFATDTGNLFFGTPGVGLGYIMVGDQTHVNETLIALLHEIKSMRLALVALACEGGRNCPQDFDPDFLSQDPEVESLV